MGLFEIGQRSSCCFNEYKGSVICVFCEGAVDVGGSSLDDSLSSLPLRHRGHTPTPVGLLPVIAAPVVATRTSRTNLPSTVCHLANK